MDRKLWRHKSKLWKSTKQDGKWQNPKTPTVGIEPTATGLKVTRSTTELSRPTFNASKRSLFIWYYIYTFLWRKRMHRNNDKKIWSDSVRKLGEKFNVQKLDLLVPSLKSWTILHFQVKFDLILAYQNISDFP